MAQVTDEEHRVEVFAKLQRLAETAWPRASLPLPYLVLLLLWLIDLLDDVFGLLPRDLND